MIRRPRLPRPSMVMLPSGVTLLNLFFGVFSLVAAARGDFGRAVLYVLIGAVCDGIDGRVARATRTGTRFGAELDSLVDAISFGLAPAMIMYFAVLHKEGWDWLFVFGFVACAVVRLARFNVEQAGRAKTHFHGLPSPAAGCTLASYYWFSQTPLYNETMIGEWPWHIVLRFVMVVLSFLMVSDFPYPAWPTFSLKTLRGALGLILFISLAIGLVFLPREFFFPVAMFYVLYGVVAAVVKGLLDRGSAADDTDESLSAEYAGEAAMAAAYAEDDTDDEADEAPADEPHPFRKRKRRRRRPRGGPPLTDRNSPPEPAE